jgi:effector-binding domain-containing protein
MKHKSIGTAVLAALFAASVLAAQTPQPVKSDTAKKAVAVQLITVEPFDYCAVEMTGDFQQHGAAFETMYSEVSAQGLQIKDAPFGVYFNTPGQVPTEQLKWEIGQILSEKKELKDPLKLKRWEFTTLVTAEYNGPFNSPEMGNVYQAVFTYIGQNGYVPAGPMMESFLNIPDQTADGGWGGHVKIYIPVQKQQAK